MAILYGEQNVDTKFSAGIEPNLYSDTVLIPGVTYTDKYQLGPAGQIMVHKIDSGVEVEPGTPGRDFDDEKAKDELIPITFNNNYQKSRKIYGVQANAVQFATAEEYLADALNMTKQGRQYSGLACMVDEGTDFGNTDVVTEESAINFLIAIRQKVKDNKGKANFAMVSTGIYASLLKKLGLATIMDPAVQSGELMKRFGLSIIECNSFDKTKAKFYNNAGTLKTIDLTAVDYIVGYNEAVSILDNFETYRLRDSENFSGTKAQVEYNTAFKVNSPKQLIIKKHGA
jgi:hypothetical protein